MTAVSRRTLLATSLVAAAPGLAFANPETAGAAEADALRDVRLFDFGWRFALGHGADPSLDFGYGFGQSDFAKTGDFKAGKTDFDDSGWRPLDLPHDWAVELPFVHDERGDGDSSSRSHGFKPLGRRFPETSVGWYRKRFNIPESDLGRRIWIDIDGAMRDVVVWINGCFIGRNDDGYSSFRFDLTDFLNYGGDNQIAVRVDASFGDGWFYEGAGLYRHVWLSKLDPVHLGQWDSVVRSTLRAGAAALDLSTRVENTGEHAAEAAVEWRILDATGRLVAHAAAPVQTLAPGASAAFAAAADLAEPRLWSTTAPNLYTAVIKVIRDGKPSDGEAVTFGVRTVRFDPDEGFFLNGEPMKIKGVCNHQDHAGVGAALPDALQRYRLSALQGMGCNAVRTAHNQPTPEWVASCDQMGVMMMCETRRMSSSPDGMRQLELMVKRYRNSPSIILWSIGNEEWVLQEGQMAKPGARIAKSMVQLCHQLDPTRPVSAAVNGNNEQGVSDALDIIGFNYHPEYPQPFHKKFPKRAIFGSETSSAIATRGEYAWDATRNTVSSYDGVVGWGQTPEQWWKLYGGEKWLAGGFAWTGFDYRGEPTPFGWPSVNSQFGVIDMCGFPKDYYHYYRAWWGNAPALHLFPHWNWPGREGEEIPVWVYSNLDEVELLVNGKSLGWQAVPHLGHVEWKARYAPGVIEARGRKGGRIVLNQKRETTGTSHTLRLTPDRRTLSADGQDVAMITVEVLDAEGRAVPTAKDRIAFRISGAGKIIGVGNGDPNCLESDKQPRRSLFNGLAQVIVQADRRGGPILLEAVQDEPRASALQPAVIALEARKPRAARPTA
ncbi:MAG: beta-galactosidase GalA [Pseudomonadota bacterium]|jgi:beta-galactosidase